MEMTVALTLDYGAEVARERIADTGMQAPPRTPGVRVGLMELAADRRAMGSTSLIKHPARVCGSAGGPERPPSDWVRAGRARLLAHFGDTFG